MVNLTDFPVCFSGHASKENKAWYWTEPMNGIIAPRSSKKLLVKGVTMGNELPHMKCEDNYFMWSGIVSEGVKPGDLGDYVKNEESTELPIVLTKMSSSTSNELIQIEPSHLCFPFLPNKILSSSMKIVNITDHYVGFGTLWKKNNVAFYDTEPQFGILPPHSTQQVVVTRVSKEDALGDLECEDRYIVWSSLVTGGAKADDLGRGHIHITKQTKEFPVIFEKRSSNELVKFDPAELCLPLWPNKSVLSSVKIVNVTEHYIGFNVCTKESNSARYYTSPSEGILPPGSTQVLVVTRIAKKNEPEVAECKSDKYFVWNGIVAQGVVASSKAIADNMSETKITMLPIGLTKPSSSDSSDELIQFDPSELCFPLLTNQKVLSSIEIVNTTEYNIGFNTYGWGSNSAWYHIKPPRGILPAWSKQNLLVEREEKEDALKYTEFNDKYFVWNTIVTQGVEESDLADYRVDQHSKELPIVLLKISPVWILQKIPTKFVKYAPTLIHVLDRIRSVFLQRSLTSLSTRADKLIRLDPPEICSSFMLNKGWLSKVDIINVTDFYVAFNLHYCPPDLNELSFEPTQGILPPRSTQTLAITRQAKEIELEDGQCRSTHFVWNRIVTESVKVSNINDYMIYEESVEIPIVLTEISTCTSDEPIQFNPPELTFSFSPNKVLLSAVNIVNITDHYVGYNSYVWDTNGAWYIPQGGAGILRPRSTRRICVKRVTKEMELQDMQCLDKFFVWNKIVTKGMKTRDIMKYMAFEESKELPIVLEKTSISTSNELITFDPPNISFPFRPNNRMVSLFKIVNITNHKIGFSICTYENDSVEYEFNLEEGILAPQSIQEIKITRIPKGEVSEDTPLEDDVVFVWNAIVAEGVEVEDLIDYMDEDESKQLPIIFTKPGERSSM